MAGVCAPLAPAREFPCHILESRKPPECATYVTRKWRKGKVVAEVCPNLFVHVWCMVCMVCVCVCMCECVVCVCAYV